MYVLNPEELSVDTIGVSEPLMKYLDAHGFKPIGCNREENVWYYIHTRWVERALKEYHAEEDEANE